MYADNCWDGGPMWLGELQRHLPGLIATRGPCVTEPLVSPSSPPAATPVYRLVTPEGDRFVAKWAVSLRETTRHHSTLASLTGTEIPAPSPVGLVELGAGNGSVLVMEHLPGMIWYSCAGDPKVDGCRVDGAVEVLMAMKALDTEAVSWRRSAFGRVAETLQADVEEYDQCLRDVAFPDVAREANELLASLTAVEPWEPVADQGDFGPHNLLCEGGVITGLVDWGRASVRDCSKVIGTAVAETLGMTISLADRAALAERFLRGFADGYGCTLAECRQRACRTL